VHNSIDERGSAWSRRREVVVAAALAAALACAACGSDGRGGGAAGAAPASRGSAGISLLATGDILLTRLPGDRMRKEGFDSLLRGIKPLVEAADLSFANLECPISTLGSPYPNKPVNVTFRASPEAAFALKDAGFDVVSLANNHMSDYGGQAVAETLRYLDLIGIAHAGAGRSGSEARAAAVARSGSFSVAFLAYAEPMWSVVEGRDPPWPAPLAAIAPGDSASAAGPGRAGTAIIRQDTLAGDIGALRARGLDLVAVSFHWGEEIAPEPSAYQKKIARMAIDAGADLVIGHHPHVLQGVERYKGGIILYSLGNAVFDMREDSTFDALAAILRLGRDARGAARIEALELLPLRIGRGTWAPSPARGEDRGRITEYLKARSSKLGLDLREGGSGRPALIEGEPWRPSLSWSSP
jgi:poly-gamma-glutamate capsule biosynthesis protein CapA/YwtB (metallophosphatase superfamily)